MAGKKTTARATRKRDTVVGWFCYCVERESLRFGVYEVVASAGGGNWAVREVVKEGDSRPAAFVVNFVRQDGWCLFPTFEEWRTWYRQWKGLNKPDQVEPAPQHIRPAHPK